MIRLDQFGEKIDFDFCFAFFFLPFNWIKKAVIFNQMKAPLIYVAYNQLYVCLSAFFCYY